VSDPTNLARLLASFFHHRLVEQRNASPATVASYRDALRLLVLHVSERTHRPPCALTIADFDRESVLEFLDHLERVRGNGVRTRNARLTAIRSFFHHVAASDPASLTVAQRILGIPEKRFVTGPPRHLAAPELEALLDAPDPHTTQGRRDRALLLFLVRTGARVSEAIGIDAADLHLEPPPQVLLLGKGGKQRTVPLSADLVHSLRALSRERELGSHDRRAVFVGARGERLTRFGVTHLVRRAVKQASAARPALAQGAVSPHTLRHTLAMRLLQSGTDLITIQAWLGHAQVATTHLYAEADVEMMRRSLELTGISVGKSPRFRTKDAVLQLLERVS
jgi:integrase/recombinase XerD